MAEALKNGIKQIFWPVENIIEMMLIPSDAKPPVPVAKPVANTWGEHFAVQTGSVPKLLVALLVWYTLDIDAAKEFRAQWILQIVFRDLFITYATAGLWDWILYGSYFRERMKPYKFNSVYPPWKQLSHDIFWCTSATLTASMVEIVVLHLWAAGYVSYLTTAEFWLSPTATVLWILLMPYWRLTHFFFIHRGMHPWRTKRVPDLGYYLYKYVHSLHHKSYNPTSFSGISMHPVESTLYYTAALVPVFFRAHPLVFLYTKMDLTMGALIGHSGFNAPGGGSYPHYLHHAKYEINYGENYAPLDWLFGTFGNGIKKRQ